ncbi:hypothetical protein P4O66_010617 [Electrophorus voltai]|uniref:Paraoxonase n=1 Tax=Electrophorus voltai TaxID=2609070 RepID=A0AAD8ZAF6_9TELE|nr:hypothetical protein P4O66_010617 [Electrophorus voltai]
MGKLAVVSVFAVAAAALIGQRLIALSHLSLAFRELTQNHLPNCHLIKGIVTGAEDITVLEDGLAFISSGLKYPGLPPYSDVPGKIYTLDLLSGVGPVDLHIRGDFDTESFNPHGISIYIDDKDGTIYLFVVNHPQNNSLVEIFKVLEDENTLEHVKTIKHALLHNVNDIVAVGVESFYATNDHYFTNNMLKTLEFLFPLHWCDVVFYSPGAVKSVAGGFASANGINISPDKRQVSDIPHPTVVQEVAVGSLCDNIEVESETGDLWMGCHPNGAKLLRSDPSDPPGSEVIRLQNIHSEEPVVTQVYMDDGGVIIGSSVAAPYRGTLLIGTVYHKALQCDLK